MGDTPICKGMQNMTKKGKNLGKGIHYGTCLNSQPTALETKDEETIQTPGKKISGFYFKIIIRHIIKDTNKHVDRIRKSTRTKIKKLML